jgi:tRNA pseudouridine38-40 synthase
MLNRAWHYPRNIDDEALLKMKEAASRFIGTYDFSAYMASNSSVVTTVRTVFDASIYRDGDVLYFRVSADGFLYNMVRIFVGTLIAVAEGKISPDDIEDITLSKDRSRAGVTAPPQGLYLNKVVY